MRVLVASIVTVVTLNGVHVLAQSHSGAVGQWGQWRGPRANGVAENAKPPTEWAEDKNVRWKKALDGEGQSTPIIWGDLVFVQSAIPDESAVTKPTEEAKPQEKKTDGDNIPPPPPDGARGDRPGPGPEGDGPPRGERGQRGGRGGRRSEAPTSPYRFVIAALDRKTGNEVWRRVVRQEVPHEGRHQDGSLAPASPFTDGKNVFAHFGSRGLYCLDMKGNPVWEKDLGDMKTRAGFGEGSTPVLHGDTIVVPWDHEEGSFIVALDRATGSEKWRRDRDEATTWATPLVIDSKGQKQVIVPGTKKVRSYDLATGDVIWECAGLGVNCIPSPVEFAGTVIVTSGYREGAMMAIRFAEAKGDISGSDAVVWKTDKGTPYVPSPLLYDDTIYFLQKNTEILSCLDPKTGKAHFEPQRLEQIDGVYASPLGADGRVYLVGRNGTTYVLKRGPTFEVLAVNKLDDDFSASPAAIGNELFLRGRKHLYCLANP